MPLITTSLVPKSITTRRRSPDLFNVIQIKEWVKWIAVYVNGTATEHFIAIPISIRIRDEKGNKYVAVRKSNGGVLKAESFEDLSDQIQKEGAGFPEYQH